MPDANILPDYSEAWYEEEELADQDNGFVEEYDITAVVLRREEKKQGQVGLVIGMLGIEGLHALDGKLENIVRSLGLAVDPVGEDHVSLGSDFDGSATMAFDTAEIAILTQEMVKADFSKERIAKIKGEDGVKFLMANLPG